MFHRKWKQIPAGFVRFLSILSGQAGVPAQELSTHPAPCCVPAPSPCNSQILIFSGTVFNMGNNPLVLVIESPFITTLLNMENQVCHFGQVLSLARVLFVAPNE